MRFAQLGHAHWQPVMFFPPFQWQPQTHVFGLVMQICMLIHVMRSTKVKIKTNETKQQTLKQITETQIKSSCRLLNSYCQQSITRDKMNSVILTHTSQPLGFWTQTHHQDLPTCILNAFKVFPQFHTQMTVSRILHTSNHGKILTTARFTKVSHSLIINISSHTINRYGVSYLNCCTNIRNRHIISTLNCICMHALSKLYKMHVTVNAN